MADALVKFQALIPLSNERLLVWIKCAIAAYSRCHDPVPYELQEVTNDDESSLWITMNGPAGAESFKIAPWDVNALNYNGELGGGDADSMEG